MFLTKNFRNTKESSKEEFVGPEAWKIPRKKRRYTLYVLAEVSGVPMGNTDFMDNFNICWKQTIDNWNAVEQLKWVN